MKALREGRVPTPGPPGEEQQQQQLGNEVGLITNDTTGDVVIPPSISEFPSPPSNFTAPLPPSSPQRPKSSTSTPRVINNTPPQPPMTPPVAPAPIAPAIQQPIPQINTPTPTLNAVSEIKVASAQKNAKWAISALDYDDIKTARLQLLAALNDIGFNQENNFGF